MRNSIKLLWVLFALFMIAGACGDDSDGESSESGGRSHTEMSPEELEVWQTDLAAVGCYDGEIDGANGPLTEAAVRAYQEAKGLPVDGLLGPQTEGALQESVAAGETVCDEPTNGGGGSGSDSATANVSSASYNQSFELSSCSLNADLSNLAITGTSGNLSLSADATEGTGTLAIDGGDEEDGVTLNGEITSVEIGADRSFSASGQFGDPSLVGETFSFAGSCPE